MRINWPLWALVLALLATGISTFALGLFLRVGMGIGVPSDTTQAKLLAVDAMATASDLLKQPQQTPRLQRFTVPRPLSNAGDAVGFTIQPLDTSTYLVRSDDQDILILLQQQPDGTDKKCLIYPARIQVSSCQLGAPTGQAPR
jgi:hypothetical protein